MAKDSETKFHVKSSYLVGCRFDNWIRLLWQNKFRISWRFVPAAMYITLVSLIMFLPAMLEKWIYGKRIRETKLTKAPVFILGHWRSGTTYLLNVMSQDEQFAYFDAVSAFSHSNFLLMGKFLRKVEKGMIPPKRPMDNIIYTTYVPQEELYAYGSIIPECIIHMTAFPRNYRFYADMAFTDRMTPKQKKRFMKTFDGVLKKLTFAKDGKRLILKSPDDTCHVNAILELHPDAKFVHIYRDPYHVIVSTIGLFNKLFPMFGMQNFDASAFLEDFIVGFYAEVYDQYFKDKENIPQGNLIEIRYEDFVARPIDTLKEVYDALGLEGFEEAKKNFESYIESLGDYQTNVFKISPELTAKINGRLKKYIEGFGYRIRE